MQVYKFIIALIICFSAVSAVQSEIKKYYFYRPENRFGSDAYFNPLSVVVNGSYDILRNGGHNKNPFRQDYRTGWDNVLDNISDPAGNIRKYGWQTFLKQECYNLSLDCSKAQFVPNVSTHIVGNGMLYVMMAEWYDYHGFKYPYFCSFFTTTVYQVANEVVENDAYRGLNVDPIADLLIFNPLGILFFSTRFGKKLFGETFPLYYWSLLPVINIDNGWLMNAGQQYIMKKKLPFGERYSAFLYWGINGLGGLTYSRDGVNNYSFGIGTVANHLNEKRKNGGRFLTPSMDGAVGFFYDRNHSLLLSVILTGPRMYNAQISVYPGLVSSGRFSPGIYLAFGEWDKFVCGITMPYFPVGIASGGGAQ